MVLANKKVCLVIPARNAGDTIEECLEAASKIKATGQLNRIIVVDDGSTDNTAQIVKNLGVDCISTEPCGRSAARNTGWRNATEDIVWFIDADCVPEPDALSKLLECIGEPSVGGAGGSFTMPDNGPLLACLIHQEIIERHSSMGARVNFVATGNAIYYRKALERVNGFDESFSRAQDAELAYRIRAAGYELAFAFDSRVRHFHDTRLFTYLRTQAKQGYWRVWLHARHASHATGDSYSSLLDNLQPPVAMLLLASSVIAFWTVARLLACFMLFLLLMMSCPMALKMIRKTGRAMYMLYVPMSAVRAVARGLGLSCGVIAYVFSRKRCKKGT